MSAPCFARIIAEDRLARILALSAQGRSVPDSVLATHEPLLDGAGRSGVPVQMMRDNLGVPVTPKVDGGPHRLVICRHCLALVLIPESELPQ